MYQAFKVKLLTATICINAIIRLEKKTQSDHCRVLAEKKQFWNSKYQMPDPIFPNVYELNNMNTETG